MKIFLLAVFVLEAWAFGWQPQSRRPSQAAGINRDSIRFLIQDHVSVSASVGE
jgi:hypothetical protein